MENNWEEEFDKQFVDYVTNAGVVSTHDVVNWQEFKHHFDAPAKVKAFISSVLQEQRQRMAKEIKGKKKEIDNFGLKEKWYNHQGYNSGLQAALNIVLGEGENV